MLATIRTIRILSLFNSLDPSLLRFLAYFRRRSFTERVGESHRETDRQIDRQSVGRFVLRSYVQASFLPSLRYPRALWRFQSRHCYRLGHSAFVPDSDSVSCFQ